MIPNLFLIAAPRSGSTQLSSWLATHPEIGMPAVKEPNFFSAHEFPDDFIARNHLNDVDPEKYVRRRSKKRIQFAIFRNPKHYLYLFEQLQERWQLDASTSYLSCPEAPYLINRHSPNARIILLTRDPVERALSHYKLAVRTGRTSRTLREEIEAEISCQTPLAGRFLLRPSMYDAPIERFQSVFDEKNRIELTFEEMIADPLVTLVRIAKFLDIDTTGFDMCVDRRNAGDAPRFKAFNSMLMQSGIKTSLRWLLPVRIKEWLKPLYFTNNNETFKASDLELLRHHLNARR